MTEEQILELAKSCGFLRYTNDDGTPSDYFDCYAEQLLKFAQAIYDEGYEQHRKDILGEELYYG
jgi:hypothetical protein